MAQLFWGHYVCHYYIFGTMWSLLLTEGDICFIQLFLGSLCGTNYCQGHSRHSIGVSSRMTLLGNQDGQFVWEGGEDG